MPQPSSLTGLLLAGGLSRRMENQEKAFLPLLDRPMLAHVLARLTPQVGEAVLNANGDPDRFKAFRCRVVADRRQGFLGPLAGVEAAFLTLACDWLLSVPVDTPFFPENLAEKMCEVAQEEAMPVVAQSLGRLHPVITLWPRSILPQLTHALDTKQLRLHDWLAKYPHKVCFFGENREGEDPFFNINTQADRSQAEERIRREEGVV
ncbi:MAG: molybdenum cofactor guanylyltransferase [Magnetococcales bacterium]|nr:molybdenum cofactor guanylyltransferase [Magnetococcales bacterium]